MGQPQWDELWLEAEGAGVLIRLSGEVLEGDESHPAPIDYELTSVGGAYTHHQDHISVDVCIENAAALSLGQPCECEHVNALQHGAEVIAIGVGCSANYLLEVRPVGVEDVVGPVRPEYPPVRFEVSHVCSDAICAVDDSEKIWEQVDQHRRQENTVFGNAQQESAANKRNICALLNRVAERQGDATVKQIYAVAQNFPYAAAGGGRKSYDCIAQDRAAVSIVQP
jgi:hypothetical protein